MTEASTKESISPFEYGLLEANTAIERYWVLYRTHCAAINQNTMVSYKGIDSLLIEIPPKAKSIPLGRYTDFNNLKLFVRNNEKEVFLFEMVQKKHPVDIKGIDIDAGNYQAIDKLKEDLKLLIITDENPWVENRENHNYGHIRKDLVLLKKGFAQNGLIYPYNNSSTIPKMEYCIINTEKKYIKNLRMYRCPKNKQNVKFLYMENQYNVSIIDIKIGTPKSSLVADHIFYLKCCYKVNFNNIIIEGTYSKKDFYGYGIYLDTVCNISFNNLIAHSNWSPFGTVNVNSISLRNCDINAFDIHCYGRDVYFNKCILRNKGIPLSSAFGNIIFENCDFINCIPIVFRSDYNAYTNFNLVLKSCNYYSFGRNCIVKATSFYQEKSNKRIELSQKMLPNVYIRNLKIYSKGDIMGNFYLFNFGRNSVKINSKISLKGIQFIPKENAKFLIQSRLAYFFADESSLPYQFLKGCSILLLITVILLIIFFRKNEVKKECRVSLNK